MHTYPRSLTLTVRGGWIQISDDLKVFERKVTTHFKESVMMDTITYLPDPEHLQKMTSCLTGHVCYTVDSPCTASTVISLNFDMYDTESNKAATLYMSLTVLMLFYIAR